MITIHVKHYIGKTKNSYKNGNYCARIFYDLCGCHKNVELSDCGVAVPIISTWTTVVVTNYLAFRVILISQAKLRVINNLLKYHTIIKMGVRNDVDFFNAVCPIQNTCDSGGAEC